MTTTDTTHVEATPEDGAAPANLPLAAVEAAAEPPVEAAAEPPVEAAAEPPVEAAAKPPVEAAAEPPVEDGPAADPVDAAPAAATDDTVAERRRIEEQLEALRQRESELRRELAKADHPELAEAIRELEICVYQVNRADARLAEGFTKGEERRRATLSKKLDGLLDKRQKLDVQIAELEAELATVGEQRMSGYETERKDAMQRLVTQMGANLADLRAAGLEPAELIPEIGSWMDEIRGLAEDLAQAKA